MEDLGRIPGAVGAAATTKTGMTTTEETSPTKTEFYRIDKSEFGGSFKKMRGALLQMVLADETEAPGIAHIRDILIFGKSPQFSDQVSTKTGLESKPTPGGLIRDNFSARSSMKQVWDRMNPPQKQAIQHCFQADDYAVVQGYPGTGKTEVLAML